MRLQTVSCAEASIATIGEHGPDPTVIFLHGNSSRKETFVAQLEALSPRYAVLAIDLPGHGASSDAGTPERTYTFAGYAGVVSQVLDKLAVGPAVLVGSSLGGHIALELATMRSGIMGIVLSGCPPFSKAEDDLASAFPPGPALQLSGKRNLGEDDVRQFLAIQQPGRFAADLGTIDALRRTDGRAREEMIGAILRPETRDQRKLAEALDLPVAAINGAGDTLVNLDHIDAVRFAHFWRGKGQRVPCAGHMVHATHPEAYNALLMEFLSDLTS